MRTQYKTDLTTGPVSGKLIAFVLPLMASNMLQHLYNAADKAVVGQFAGKIALAAVGSTGSATTMLLNLLFGMSVGANIINSNLLGANRTKELRRSMHTGMSLSVIFGSIVCVLGIFAARPILQLMSCPESVIDSAMLYMRIYFCGVPGSMFYNFGAGILRTHGDTRRPMMILGVSGVVNVVLNLVFVILFKMSVAGVAIATVISQYVSAVWVGFILFDPKGDFALRFSELKPHTRESLAILRIGIPCGINGLVFSFSNVIVQSTVNGFGDTVVAGNVAADSVTGLLYQVLSAFYSACVSYAGQCYGAAKYKRIDKLLLSACAICSGFVALLSVAASLFPQTLLGLFNQDPQVIAVGKPKLLLVCWSYILYGISEVLLGCLRGMRKTAVPTTANILGVCVIRVLWVLLVFPLMPSSLFFLYLCYPVSYVVSAAALGCYYWYCRRKLNKKLQPVQ